MTGIVFDIKEFSLHDGPGARVTVFLKGCPLRCRWCHNPEGLSPKPQLLYKKHLCQGCGLCTAPPTTPLMTEFHKEPSRCPNGLLSLSGKEYTPEALVQKLLPYLPMLKPMEGGITFSGGEPLLQGEFLSQCLARLKKEGFHLALETSGYAPKDLFTKVCQQCDLVLMDLKLMDPQMHRQHTGVDNESILNNARWLQQSGIPHCFRTPLIPGITDTQENLAAVCTFVGNSPWEQLPYNNLAGAKYPLLDMQYPYEKGSNL